MTRAAVTAEGLVLGYEGNVAVAKSSFEVPAGKVTAVIGPNGSGKSTLLNGIAGLLEPMSGSIDVPAREIGSERVAYVLQTTKVNDSLPISVAEVVGMGRFASKGWHRRLDAEDRAAIEEAMARTGIIGLRNRHLRNLSGGERQRVFVAQGIAQDHDLLLLDEPLTGIDLAAARAIDDVIHAEIEDGCTVIMTTHDLSEAMIADHVLLLAGGVVASGPPDEALTGENLAEAYGQALLHVGEGQMFLDDPAHMPVPGRHVHRLRSVHPEASPDDAHGGD